MASAGDALLEALYRGLLEARSAGYAGDGSRAAKAVEGLLDVIERLRDLGGDPPPMRGRRDIYLDILSRGVLNARDAGRAGDAVQAAAEADHLHNVPDLLRHFADEALHGFYQDCMRPSYLGYAKPEYAQGFAALWTELDAAGRGT